MTTEKQSAQDRGIDLINELVEAHLSSIDALRITSHSGGQVDNLTVALHEFYKYEPGRHDEFRKRTEKTIERAKQQERVKFLYLRRALLIALCSSLEIIVKDHCCPR